MKQGSEFSGGAAAVAAPRRLPDRWLALASSPDRVVWLLAIVLVLLWGVLAALFDPAPPTDSLETVLFSQSLHPFYVKHPALPTWILYGVERVVGLSIGSTFVLGALCAALALVTHYAWAREQVGAQRAAIATLLASTIVYFNAGAIQYSNNTAQLPFAMLSIVVFHAAVTRGGNLAWVLLGTAAGLMVLAKLSAVVLFASFALYLLWTGRLRERATWCGLGLAALVFATLVAPALVAAYNVDPEADRYMHDMIFPSEVTRVRRLLSVWDFLNAQLAVVAPALLVFALLRRRVPDGRPKDSAAPPLVPFLTIVGFGPLVLTVVIAVATGARLLSGWGTTFFVLLPLWLVAAQRHSIDATHDTLARAAFACLSVQLVLWVALIANGGALPNLHKTHHHGRLPPAALAEAVRRAWNAQTSAPLRYVVSDIRTGAAMAIVFGGTPLVIDGNRPDFARTLPPEVQAGCGFVVVSGRSARDRSAPNYDPLDDLIRDAVLRPVSMRLADKRVRTYFIGVHAPTGDMPCGD